MSFILDALRKSERERQQQATPGIGDAGYRPPKKTTHRWLLTVIAILGINAVLIAALLMRGDDTPPGARTVQPAPVPRATPAPSRRPALTAPKREDIRPLAEEVADPAEAEAAATVAMATSERPAAGMVAAPPPPVPAPSTPAGSTDAGLPTMEALVLEGRLEMQPLRLDIHVYSEVPNERFVFINMSKYREGQTLKEGPRVLNITTDGVVLNHQGNEFVLTR